MSLNTLQRQATSILRKLPEDAKTLLTTFFNDKLKTNVNTRLTYIKAMKSYCDVVPTPLTETCNQNLSQWYSTVNTKLKAGGLHLNATKLRTLYAFHLEHQGQDEEEAKQHAKKLFKVIPFNALKREADKQNGLRDKIVSPEKFKTLLNATDHPRLRAEFVTSEEATCRPQELCQTRIGDLTFYQTHAEIIVKGKTGERPLTLTWSIPYLRAWLQVHPDKANPDAPLFAVVHKGRMIFPNPNTIRSAFHRLRKKLGIKRGELFPYMLRHTGLTDLAKKGLPDYIMKTVAGWTPDSKMAARYIHISGRDSVKAVLEAKGVVIPAQEKKKDYVETKTCPRCNAENEADAIYCLKCSLALDKKVLFAQQQEIAKTDKLMDHLIQHPTVQQAIKNAVKEMVAQGSWKP